MKYIIFEKGCYCRDCTYSEEAELNENNWVTSLEDYQCNLNCVTMPLDGFCSEGRRDKKQ